MKYRLLPYRYSIFLLLSSLLPSIGCSADSTGGGTGRTTITAADGTMREVEGVLQADGSILQADGSRVLPDGSVVSPDGTVMAGAITIDGPTLDFDPQEGRQETPPGCGDATLTSDEACDDGNLEDGDGCAADCLAVEPGFTCAPPGLPCSVLAKCGDGVKVSIEPCDDGNTVSGDGCSDRCRIELGWKCEGSPSSCSAAVCGDGNKEGAEACDDNNTSPFDGCSSLCLREPNCEGQSCTSECGDGLVINEECDDGNLTDGDGCSSACTFEEGYTCDRDTACEMINGECILRVPAIFRDFPATHQDFTEDKNCSSLAQGAVQENLDDNGRPVLASGAQACISSAVSFADWYVTGGVNQEFVGEILLFDNGRGGYVNRFDNEGNYFTSIDSATETSRGNSAAACEMSCANEARNNHSAGCDNECRTLTEDVRQIDQELTQAVTNRLPQAEMEAAQQMQEPEDGEEYPALVQAVLDDIARLEADLAAAEALADECMTTCTTAIADETAICAATCGPCSYDPDSYCTGGELVDWEGNPLFFPVDGVTGSTAQLAPAKIPSQYGFNGWPWEDEWFPGAPDHNFKFTSEVLYWFQYEQNTTATLDFVGDDDVWVFINGKLAVDIGGVHVPVEGSVSIDGDTITSTVVEPGDNPEDPPKGTYTDTWTTADFGMQAGSVYKIVIFHAERKEEGSSFKLTLSGFEAVPSVCTPICGDGILALGEECDDGVNDGGYGECDVGCRLGPSCGDGILQEEQEDCDDGNRRDGDGCGSSCRVLTIR